MSVSRVHHCIDQKRVVRGTLEPPVTRICRCRKFISLRTATQLVKDNDAKWTVTKRIYVTKDEPCLMCFTATDPEKKTCARCNGKGTVPVTRDESEHSNDIVLIGQDQVVYEKPKTPRTATIEQGHLERAYVDSLTDFENFQDAYIDGLTPGPKREWTRPNAARDRIEEYGIMIQEARAFVGKDKVPAIGVEPGDNWKMGQGPTYDRGWGVLRTCAFEEGIQAEDKPVKDKPSLDGQRNYTETQDRAKRLAKLMETL